jgi:hypothetical protein
MVFAPERDGPESCCESYCEAPVNMCGRDQQEEKHMPQSEQLEVLVLGSGTGGKLIAWYIRGSSCGEHISGAVPL